MKYKKLSKFADKYNFDILAWEVEGKSKRPIGVKDFLSPDVSIKDTAGTRRLMEGNCPHMGIILKNEVGIKLKDRQLVVVDIDDKEKTGKADEIIDQLCLRLMNHGVTLTSMMKIREQSKNGGHHIFLTTDRIGKIDPILVSKEPKVEVEVFTQGRGIVTAPSEGYKTESGDCVDYDTVYDSFVPMDELISILGEFRSLSLDTSGKEDSNSKAGFELIHDAEIDKSKMEKLEKGWVELQRFFNGRTDEDWNTIHDVNSRDYVRGIIMPYMVATKQKKKFIDTIKQYRGRWLSQWIVYPDWWENKPFDERPYKTEVRAKLIKLGLAKKVVDKEKYGVQNIVDRYYDEQVPEKYKGAFIVNDSIYRYDENLRHCKCMTLDELRWELEAFVEAEWGHKILDATAVTSTKTLISHIRRKAGDSSDRLMTKYDFNADTSYRKKVALAFNNGTLYMHRQGKEIIYDFQEDFHGAEDKCLFTLDIDYEEDLTDGKRVEGSPVYEWFFTKLKEPSARRFVKMFLGSILVPAYNPEVLLTLYTEKGATGKSTFAKTIRRVIDGGLVPTGESKITVLPLSKIGDRFEGAQLAQSLLNLPTEVDGTVQAEAMKTLISREEKQVEKKGIDSFKITPLAKHLGVGNKPTEVNVNDGGVKRRLVSLRISDERVMEDVMEANEFGYAFFEDYRSLFKIMFTGLQMLMRQGFPNMSDIWLNDEGLVMYREELGANNSSVDRFLVDVGYLSLLASSKSRKDLYNEFTLWCEENGVGKPPIQKYFLNSVASSKYIDMEMPNENRQRRNIGIKEKYKDIVFKITQTLKL